MNFRNECLVKTTSAKLFVVSSEDDSRSIRIINNNLNKCKEYKVDNCLLNKNDGKQCDKLLLANLEEHFIEFKSNHGFSEGINHSKLKIVPYKNFIKVF